MIYIRDLSYSYGLGHIFDHAQLSLGEHTKAGLVGPNGAGKSTLFRLLMEPGNVSHGVVQVDGMITMVPQEVTYDPHLEVSETVRAYLDPTQKHEDFELETMLAGMELTRVSLPDDPRPMSGGQKTKLAIIRALLAKPDILLLDEPTNFLDDAGKQWVMQFLAEYPNSVLIISHDLPLLDQHIDKVFAINTHTKQIEEYKGTYTKFLQLKKERDDLQRRHILQEQKRIRKMEESVTKLYANKSKKGVRQRVVLTRRLERMKEKLPEMPPELQRIKIRLPHPAPVGEIPIKAAGLSKSYGTKQVLTNVSFALRRGERFAVLGKNGVGKTTLMRMLTETVAPDEGVVLCDTNLKLGYYSQEKESFDLNKSIMDTAVDSVNLSQDAIRPILARFLFQGKKVMQSVGSLSGGEKTRLSIALLLLHDYNTLLLDEPTTYLDVLSQRVILDALKAYTGAMIIVSHTEEFIQELQPNRALLLPENKLDFWSEDFLERVGEI
jgi:ATPase subunit of ABC transporter with duplicated ATPase domains